MNERLHKLRQDVDEELAVDPIVQRTGRVSGADAACIDCGADTTDEQYMVKDDVWLIGERDGELCIACLERRIDRQLTPTDFDNCLLNWMAPKSDRLRNRLGHAVYLRENAWGLWLEANPKEQVLQNKRMQKFAELVALRSKDDDYDG
jgi:hypothetical protein